MTTMVDRALIHSGDRVKLKDLLCNRLTECGWRDEVRLMCRNVIREHGAGVGVEHIIAEVTPKARSIVPDVVKKELLMKIKSILIAEDDDLDL